MTETTTGHTPGPWTTFRLDEKNYIWGGAEHDIAVGTIASESDAALVVAAPDLLAALEAVLGMNMPPAGQPGHIDWMQAAEMAQRAVARARGIGQNIDTRA